VIKDNRVVLILGAGASHPYGFPLGQDLVEQIKGMHGSTARLAPFADATRGKWDHATINKFCDELRRSNWISIDRFLQRRSELADIGKAAVAFHVLECERWQWLTTPAAGRWYNYLYNHILDPVGPDEFGANQLSIITYNYDRSLEQFLFDALQSSFNLSSEKAAAALNKIPFVHVHGSFGDLSGVGPDPRPYQADKSELFRATARMHIVSDDIASSGVLKKCDELLRQATHVVFLGFGYDRVNLERLDLGRFREATYWGTVYGLTTSEVDATLRPQFAATGSQLHTTAVDVDCLRFLREHRDIFR
jgi:hypothetical protein